MILSLIASVSLTAFPTELQAASAELNKAYWECPTTKECGGVIYLGKDGKYYSSGLETGSSFGLEMPEYYTPLPEGMVKITADYHTHICSIHNKPFAPFFSPGDIDANQGFNTVGYMLCECDGVIRRWAPGDDRDDEEVDFKKPDGTKGKVIYLTTGHIVGFLDEVQNKNHSDHRIQAPAHQNQVQERRNRVQPHS